MKSSPYRLGFTLIEIISVLVILASLAAVAVPKYFDLQEESERKAALSAVAEAQSRIQRSFGQQLLQGKPCGKAVEEVSEISKLSDDGKSKFGDFSLGIDKNVNGGTLTTAGVAIYARRGDNDTAIETRGKLYLPSCSDEESAASQFMKSTINQMIDYLMRYGNNDHDPTNGRKNPEFRKKYLNKDFDMGNGVTASIDDDNGSLIGIKNNYVQMKVIFKNEETDEKIEVRFITNKDGSTTINNMKYWDANSKNGTTIVNNVNGTNRTPQALDSAKKVAQNLGLNTNSFGSVFDSAQHTGFINVGSGFTF